MFNEAVNILRKATRILTGETRRASTAISDGITATSGPVHGAGHILPDSDQRIRDQVARSNDSTVNSPPPRAVRQSDEQGVVESGSKQLTNGEKHSLYNYSKFGSAGYNSSMRNGEPIGFARIRIEEIVNAIKKLPIYSGIAYRGEKLSLAEIDRYQEGAIVVDRGFKSASSDEKFAHTGNAQFRIKSKNGRILGEYSSIPGESEVVFLPGTQFKVIKVVHDKDLEKYTIDMEEL
ncbi:ADP-ribosyltransferase [Nocardia australiensis]|uniref:ADP-ribosyltransferase n=1 Tax=Nocardia australiensis TaxID=2887191 RepID=UPI001D13B852|nr:ADP-ribosyltransferase [Nocardia australiensis]